MAFRQDIEARRLSRLGREVWRLLRIRGVETPADIAPLLGCSFWDGRALVQGWWDEFRVSDLLRYINILRCSGSTTEGTEVHGRRE